MSKFFKQFFACPKCGGPICSKEELEECEYNYCIHCGEKIEDEIKEAKEKGNEQYYEDFFICQQCGEPRCTKKELLKEGWRICSCGTPDVMKAIQELQEEKKKYEKAEPTTIAE